MLQSAVVFFSERAHHLNMDSIYIKHIRQSSEFHTIPMFVTVLQTAFHT